LVEGTSVGFGADVGFGTVGFGADVGIDAFAGLCFHEYILREDASVVGCADVDECGRVVGCVDVDACGRSAVTEGVEFACCGFEILIGGIGSELTDDDTDIADVDVVVVAGLG